MAHIQQMFFIENIAKHFIEYFINKKVLEVGSFDINGSVRSLFKDCDYIGIDILAGNGVDCVCRGEDFEGHANSFDVVISSEMFEHNIEWVKCFLNMLRLLKKDGLMVFTCASAGRMQHGTQKYFPELSPGTVANGSDYYKNLTKNDIETIVDLKVFFEVYAFYEDRTSADLYFFGIGKKSTIKFINLANKLIMAFDDYYYKKNVLGEY